ncbi:uncharacterized protein H6S33_007534 [Morchella sextelata]|uniref:uncharacterized protein n=1 Tax=Morchella sextelata TaxID=1174677 RepID=UPI001D03840A|nr:uncharacterized protein H6S33_007534 [Morchella sextelata]KAH0603875.1 hypothetical protein H6S33_007534 [Morchella sextelata]
MSLPAMRQRRAGLWLCLHLHSSTKQTQTHAKHLHLQLQLQLHPPLAQKALQPPPKAHNGLHPPQSQPPPQSPRSASYPGPSSPTPPTSTRTTRPTSSAPSPPTTTSSSAPPAASAPSRSTTCSRSPATPPASPSTSPKDVERYTWFVDQGGRIVVSSANHDSRDEAMTRASHYDVLRCRTVAECRALFGERYKERVSGTQKNQIRRKRGIGLVWREVVEEVVETAGAVEAAGDREILKNAQRMRGLESKVKEARALRERLQKGEVLEKNQVDKAGKLEVWERELEGLK